MGSASPDIRLHVRGVAVTDSVRFCGGGIDSFLGFEYGVVITLASHVFEYFFRFFLRACGFCAFLASLGSHGVVTPLFWPTVFLTCGPFIGFLGFFGVPQGYSCVGVDRQDDYSARFFCSALRSAALVAVFSRISRFSQLVSDHLRNFSFYSWASLLVLPFLLCLPVLLSLSPKVTNLGGFSCRPPSLVAPVFVFGDFSFCSSSAVSSSSSSCWG